MCPQDCVVPYSAVQHHVDIYAADMHGTTRCLNGPKLRQLIHAMFLCHQMV